MPTTSTSPSPISPDRVVYDLPSLSYPRISPDGKNHRIAFVRSQGNRETGKPESNIWLIDVDGSNLQ